MRNFLLAAIISAISVPILASDVGVTISIGQPGSYGQIILGNQYPVPQLLYPNPIRALPPAVVVQQPPIYLYVPPGHAKRWDKHCHRYNACYQQVYFVEKNWYDNVYMPHYHSQGDYPGRYNDGGRHHTDDSRDRSQRKNQSQRYSGENDQGERRGYDRHPGRGNGGNDDRGGNHDKKGHERGNHRKD